MQAGGTLNVIPLNGKMIVLNNRAVVSKTGATACGIEKDLWWHLVGLPSEEPSGVSECWGDTECKEGCKGAHDVISRLTRQWGVGGIFQMMKIGPHLSLRRSC